MPEPRRSHRRGRALIPLAAAALVLAACSSDAAVDAVDADVTTTIENVDGFDGPVDPARVEQLGLSLVGTPMSSDATACILDRADGDSTLTAAYAEGTAFTPEVFTALGVAMHACVDNDVLAGSLLPLSGAEGSGAEEAFTSCVTDDIGNPVDGDLKYVGMAALRVGFPVPEGAYDATIDTGRSCIPAEGVANQFAVATEQASGFAVEVDRGCLVDAIDDAFLDSFWTGLVRADTDGPDLGATIDDCSEEYSSGLPVEVPGDFEPWSGTSVLAAIDPGARLGVYDAPPPITIDSNATYEAILTTDDGEIRIALFTDTAPETVNNFVSLARDGYYDGTIFHRVIAGFMAQAGDPTGTGTGGPGYQFDDEESGFTPVDRRGLLAMANSGPDTNGSQFFITFEPADHLTGAHVVFGEVVDGDDVLAAIRIRDPQAPTHRGEMLISVEIVER